jgi:4-carboxymuconolactone decarboxylase
MVHTAPEADQQPAIEMAFIREELVYAEPPNFSHCRRAHLRRCRRCFVRRAGTESPIHLRKRQMTDDRAARGKKIRDEAFGKDGLKTWDELNAICPTHAKAIHEYCFGTIWDRPHLDLKTRELIVIAAAVASDCPNEVALHARGALNRGGTREEIIETILQCAPYVGFPKTNHALKAAKDVFDRWEAKKEDWKAL